MPKFTPHSTIVREIHGSSRALFQCYMNVN